MDRYQRLFEAVHDQMPGALIVVEAPSGRILYRNAQCEALLGETVPSFSGVDEYTAMGALHEDGTPYAAHEYTAARALAGEHVRAHRLRYRRPDGRIVYLNASASPVYDRSGNMTHAVVIITDASERQAIEAALHEGRERLAAALDASNTGTFRWDIRTNALDWDDNLDRLFGLAPGQTARRLDEFIARVHPDDRERVIAAVGRSADHGAVFDEEFRVVWPDGTIHWLHDRGRTYSDAQGQPLYMAGACVDVTDRRVFEDQLRTITESVPQLVWTATADGNVDYFNDRWYEYTGMAHATERPHTLPDARLRWWAYLHPDDEIRTLERWEYSVSTGQSYETEYRLREAATGQYRWFIGRAVPLRDPSGRVTRWFGSCTDIESQVQSTELARYLERCASGIAAAPDAKGVAETVLAIGCEALGAHQASVATVSADGLFLETRAMRGNVPDDVRDAWMRYPATAAVPLAEVFRSGKPLILSTPDAVDEYRAGLGDTARRSAVQAGMVFPLPGPSSPIGALGFVFDDRRFPTEEQQRFVSSLAQQCADGFQRARLVEAERRANERTHRLLAFSTALAERTRVEEIAELAVGMGLTALEATTGGLYLVEPNGLRLAASIGFGEEIASAYHVVPMTGSMPTVDAVKEQRIVALGSPREMGEQYPHVMDVWAGMGVRSLVIVPLVGGFGEERRVVGTLGWSYAEENTFDADFLTFASAIAQQTGQALERARLFEAERQARARSEAERARAEDANRAKSDFLAVMSHELRTPLNAIAGYAQLMEAGVPVAPLPEHLAYLGRIQTAQRHLLHLINSVLNFAKLEAGKVEFQLEDIPATELLAAVEPLVQPQILGKQQQFASAIPVDELCVRADRDKTSQILLNLVSNAIKFTPEHGRITLDAFLVDDATIGIRVGDTGRGIPAEKLRTIFDPFVQLDTGFTRESTGTGLGLAISRELARAMDGDITAESVEGKGSTFVLTLPRVVTAPGESCSSNDELLLETSAAGHGR